MKKGVNCGGGSGGLEGRWGWSVVVVVGGEWREGEVGEAAAASGGRGEGDGNGGGVVGDGVGWWDMVWEVLKVDEWRLDGR